jgi:hypothetical protein
MTFLLYLLTILNLVWAAYLTYLVYRRNINKNKPATLATKENKLKITVTRFNPFEDIGGDQSFILCVLDDTNSGAIITSLHSRDFTRVYAKPIKNGEGDSINLSKEEKLAIIKTIKS